MKSSYKKIKTEGKTLSPEMAEIVAKFVDENMGLFVTMAKEWAKRYNIPVHFVEGRPNGLLEDLISVAIYGCCRGGLAWQEKVKDKRPITNFEGELRQASRVRVKHLASRINKFPDLLEDISLKAGLEIQDTSDHDK